MTDPNQRAIGVEHNGQIWDGTQWVPAPMQAPTVQPSQSAGGWNPGPVTFASSGFLPQQGFGGGFANPYYSYGLTKRASDDIHFIARFTVIMIWIWIVTLVIYLVFVGFSVLTLGSLFARLGR